MSNLNQEMQAIRSVQKTLEKLGTAQRERVWSFVTAHLREQEQEARKAELKADLERVEANFLAKQKLAEAAKSTN